jgi:hypothetical protein
MQPIGNELNTKEKKKIIALLFPWGFFFGLLLLYMTTTCRDEDVVSLENFFPLFFFIFVLFPWHTCVREK